MNDWNILIIDDEAIVGDDDRSRFVLYKKLENQKHSGKNFVLTFAESVEHARQLLTCAKHDLVLLDVRLPGWGDNNSGHLFNELFKSAAKRHTVGLVSNQWNEDGMEIVRQFLLDNSEISMPLFFTLRDFENNAFAVIASQIVTHVMRQRNQYELKIGPNTELRLLHISDLHFGSDKVNETLAGPANTLHLCDSIKQCWAGRDAGPEGPDLVVVTGDIGNTGHPNDYTEAEEWFKNFARAFGWSLPTPKFLIVPGNHDFSVPLCSAHRIQLGADKNPVLTNKCEEIQEQLANYAMLPFSQFATRVCGNRHLQVGYPLGTWVESGFAGYGVVFSGFNTSRYPDYNSWPLRKVHRDDIAGLNNYLRAEISVSDFIHIVLSHHSLVRYGGAREEISNSRECSEHLLRKPRSPQLLLHGHEHRRWGALPDGMDFLVVAAPAPTGNHASSEYTTACGLNLLELSRSGSVVSRIYASSLVKLEGGWQKIELPGKSTWTPLPKRSP